MNAINHKIHVDYSLQEWLARSVDLTISIDIFSKSGLIYLKIFTLKNKIYAGHNNRCAQGFTIFLRNYFTLILRCRFLILRSTNNQLPGR